MQGIFTSATLTAAGAFFVEFGGVDSLAAGTLAVFAFGDVGLRVNGVAYIFFVANTGYLLLGIETYKVPMRRSRGLGKNPGLCSDTYILA